MISSLTKREAEVFDFVCAYQRAQGIPPSAREVGRKLKCSQPAATAHLQALARKGRLAKLADRKWGLKPAAVQRTSFEIPVYGTIPAGIPAMQEQEVVDTVRIDPALFGVTRFRPNHFWFLRVSGDSMCGANILHGDLVALVRREPRPGEIVAALVDETDTTLKRLVHAAGRTLLRAANPRYPDIVPEHLESQGVVIGVIRPKLLPSPVSAGDQDGRRSL